jgi:tetratricopeptide (TPR) repeat protein
VSLSLAILIASILAGCWSRAPEPDPLYRPTENVLEAVAVLRLHIDDDTYRFPPARDFTGKNVYRASLRRLEALEQIHAEKFRSGYLTDVLLFAKGRALERIGEYELAADHYARVAELDSVLLEPALEARDVNERLHRARSIEPGPDALVEQALAEFDERERLLDVLAEEIADTHYAYVVKEEREVADQARAEYFRARRRLEARLDALTLQQYQSLIQRNRESKYRNRHLIDLADLYAELAAEYARKTPPVSLDFDPATFDEYAFGATRLYEAVSQQDGAVEKIEASRKLEAFLAFTLQVQDEKIPH